MKRTILVMAALLALLPALAYGREHASLRVVNEGPFPIHVDIEEEEHTVFVGREARMRHSDRLAPGGDIAMRVTRGPWQIVGDNRRALRTFMHGGHDYTLQLKPFANGYERGLVGEIDDGYSSHSEYLVAFPDNFAPPGERPDYVIDPRHTPTWQHDPRSEGAKLGEGLAEALGDALEHLMHND